MFLGFELFLCIIFINILTSILSIKKSKHTKKQSSINKNQENLLKQTQRLLIVNTSHTKLYHYHTYNI